MTRINKIIDNKFFRGVVLISGGTAFAQVVNTVMSPIITRIYSPEEYGVLTVYTAFLSIIAIAGALKYEWSIPISKDDKEAINVLALSILVIGILSVALFFIFQKWGEAIFTLFHSKVLIKYHLLIPFGVLFTGIYTVCSQWALRKKYYKDISKTKIAQSVSQNASKIGLGLIGLGPLGLIVGRILGQSAGIITYIKTFIYEDRLLIKSISFAEIKRVAIRYRKFPIYGAPSQILNATGIQLPVILITLIYGSDIVGYYGLATTIVSLPMNLIGISVADVFYSEAASIGKTNPVKLRRLIFSLTKKLILVGLAPLIILILWGPNLFSLIFGSSWYEAGIYARIISFLIYSRFVFTPFSRILNVYEKQLEVLLLDILRIIVVLTLFFIVSYISVSSYLAIGIYSIAMSFIYLLTFIIVIKILNNNDKINI